MMFKVSSIVNSLEVVCIFPYLLIILVCGESLVCNSNTKVHFVVMAELTYELSFQANTL